MGHSARWFGAVFAALCVGVGGCATCPQAIRSALAQPFADRGPDAYTLACPDRVHFQFDSRPDLCGEYPIESDGCVALGDLGRIRVDGSTPREVAGALSRTFAMPAESVRVTVLEFASRHVLLFGPTDGAHRVIAYRGPESVTDLLRRDGGLATGTAFRDIHVVRSHVAEGRRPEVFPVDLEAILIKGDLRSDVMLKPYDQVYLAETRGAHLARCMPPWLRTVWPGIKAIDEVSNVPNNEGE